MTEDWKVRLEGEHAELCARMGRLRVFLETNEAKGLEDYPLLVAQLESMSAYEAILRKRLERAEDR